MDQEQASRRLAESQRLLTEGLARIERQRTIIDHLDQRLGALSEWRRRKE
jgi:hypothetical protein